MADRNYVTRDFAAKLERARRKIDRRPQPRLLPNLPRPPVPPIVSSLFRVYNNGEETIPQFAVMQVEDLSERTGFSGTQQDAYAVKQYDGTPGCLILINSGGEIEQRRFGGGLFPSDPCKVLIDDAGADPSFLDCYGPVEDEWHLAPSNVGFLWLGQMDEEEGTATFIQGIPPGAVIFRNDASETAPKYGCGRITGDEDVGGNSVTKIVKPDTTFSREHLIVGPQDVAAGAYGYGYLMDGRKVRALYDTGTPAYGEGWGPKPSQWSLAKGYYGGIVFGDNDTDALTTTVKTFTVQSVQAKTNGSHAKGATQNVDLYTGDGVTAITSMQVSAKNVYAALTTGKHCTIHFQGNTAMLVAGEC